MIPAESVRSLIGQLRCFLSAKEAKKHRSDNRRSLASASWTLRAPPLLKRPSAARSERSALGHRTLLRNSSSVTRMSLMICRKSGGAISRPEWKGTGVPLPSRCRNWRCAPRWRTSTKPRRSSARITSRGLRTRGADLRPRGAWLQPREDSLEARQASHPVSAPQSSQEYSRQKGLSQDRALQRL